MRCKIFRCPTFGTYECCAECPIREGCPDPCLNHPDRCGQVRRETPKELLLKYGVKIVRPLETADILKAGKPLGLFYERLGVNEGYLAIDNRDGDPVMKVHKTIVEMIDWFITRGATSKDKDKDGNNGNE